MAVLGQGRHPANTATTTEVVVFAILGQGRHPLNTTTLEWRRCCHSRAGDALQRAPKRPTRTASRRLARAAIVLWWR